jgi:pyruvate dehydrogenase E1 component alpha subunit
MAGDPLTQRVPLCAAAARGMQAAGTESLVLALTQTGDREPGWQAALEWAQRAQLPLLLICEDVSGGARSSKQKGRQEVLDFEAITQLAKRIKLPVLPVDGEDAVAVYRVLQECVLRTRMGGGPAVVWAVLTPASSRLPKLKRSATPLVRLQRYMTSRAIPFAKTSI